MKVFLLSLLILSFEVKALTYLSPESLDLTQFPGPPALNSREDLTDLEMVLSYQTSRTQEDCARARVEDEGSATAFFGNAYGPLNTIQTEKLEVFHKVISGEVSYFAKMLKEKFPRERPFNRDPRISPCVSLANSLSYPSGHAALAIVAARTYALIFPAKKDYLLFRADVIAQDRIVGGVHHVSDVQAGKALGEKIFEALMRQEAFINDVKGLAHIEGRRVPVEVQQ